jgi:3D-(3,5/4)-trihydroxycyclohexane-1,2-dione acylhydrolase (decyclizing)
MRAKSGDELRAALVDARKRSGVTVVVVETAIDPRVPGYESWWDVAIAEVSESSAVRDARKEYEKARQKERIFL